VRGPSPGSDFWRRSRWAPRRCGPPSAGSSHPLREFQHHRHDHGSIPAEFADLRHLHRQRLGRSASANPRRTGAPQISTRVTNYPTIGDTVELITNQELRTVYAPSGSDQINVGTCSRSPSSPMSISTSMLSSTFAVLGSPRCNLGEFRRERYNTRECPFPPCNKSSLGRALLKRYAQRTNLECPATFTMSTAAVSATVRWYLIRANLKLPFLVVQFERSGRCAVRGRPGVPRNSTFSPK